MAQENTRSKAPENAKNRDDGPLSFGDLDALKRETLHALVGEQILYRLGKPQNLLSIQVRPVGTSSYRVNVFVGSVTAARVAHSFFVSTDTDGAILASAPSVERLY